MRYDEYNKVEIKNDYEGSEFGRTQKAEFTDYPGNADVIGGAMNRTDVINDIREKNGMLRSEKLKYEKKNNTETTSEQIKNITNVTASAGTGAVVTGAAVVTVTTVTAVIGINIISNTKAEFQYLEADSHNAYYECELMESNNAPFLLHFENENYHKTKDLVEGHNKGEFNDLEPDTEYTISVKSADPTETLIYETNIRTLPDIEPTEVTSFIFDKTANFLENSFSLSFTYTDPNEEMNDFEFVLYDVEERYRVYPVEKTTDIQTFYGEPTDPEMEPYFDFTSGETFRYEFAYYLGEERVIFESGSFVFTDNSGAKQEFRGYTVDNDANFLQKILYVTLDMDNDLEHYSDFTLSLTCDAYPTLILPIETTNQKQAVYIRDATLGADGQELDNFTFEGNSFTYSLTYYNRGERIVVDGEEPIMFNDISGAVQEFRGITIEQTANFLTKTFYVTLDMDNDYLHFSDFVLFLYSDEQPTLIFNLETTTNRQEVKIENLDYLDQVDLDHILLDRTFTYELTYKDMRETKNYASQVSFTFIDNSGAKQEFRSFTLHDDADYLEKEFYVTLDFDNDYNYYSDFEIILKSEGQPNAIFTLASVTTKQTISIYDATFNISDVEPVVYETFSFDTDFEYEFSYYNLKTETREEFTGTKTFTDNSGAVQEFRSFSIDTEANFLTKTISVNLDFDNDYGYYSNFKLVLASQGQPTLTWNLSDTSGKQALKVSDASYTTVSSQSMSNFTLHNKLFSYTFSYYNYKTDETITQTGTIVFTDNSGALQEFRGATISNQADFLNEKIYVTLDMDNELSELSGFTLQLSCSEYTIYFSMQTTNQQQELLYSNAYGSNRPSYMDFTKTYTAVISYYNMEDYCEYELYDTITFVDKDNRVTSFNGFEVSPYFNWEEPTLDITLDFVDDFNYLSNFTATLYMPYYDEDENIQYDTYDFDLEKTTETQELDLTEYEIYFEYGEEYSVRVYYNHAKLGGKSMLKTDIVFESAFYFEAAYIENYVLNNQNSYYLLAYLDFADHKDYIDHITLTVDYYNYDSDKSVHQEILLDKVSGYSYVNFDSFLQEYVSKNGYKTESANSDGYPTTFTVEYNIRAFTHDGDSWMVCESSILDLNMDYNGSTSAQSYLSAVEMYGNSISASNPIMQLKFYGRKLTETFTNYELKIYNADDPNNTYVFELDEMTLASLNTMTDYYSLNLSTHQNWQGLLTLLRNNSVTIEVSFNDYYGAHILTVLENTRISIN